MLEPSVVCSEGSKKPWRNLAKHTSFSNMVTWPRHCISFHRTKAWKGLTHFLMALEYNGIFPFLSRCSKEYQKASVSTITEPVATTTCGANFPPRWNTPCAHLPATHGFCDTCSNTPWPQITATTFRSPAPLHLMACMFQFSVSESWGLSLRTPQRRDWKQ